MRRGSKILLTILGLLIVVTPLAAQTKNGEKMGTIHLNTEEFLERVYNFVENENELKFEGDRPVLVDFYASWCGPCKALAPILEELAEEYGDQIYIYKVDTEEATQVAQAFNIRSIPTLLFIPLVGKPTIAQGALPKADLKRAIDEIMLGK